MSHRLAVLIWTSLLVLGLLIAKGPLIEPVDISRTNTDGKLGYELHAAIQDWKTQVPGLSIAPPVVAIVVTLDRLATNADLELFLSTADTVTIQGAFGRLVQLTVALSQIEAIAALEQVRSIALPLEQITNQESRRQDQ